MAINLLGHKAVIDLETADDDVKQVDIRRHSKGGDGDSLRSGDWRRRHSFVGSSPSSRLSRLSTRQV
jgi:hypothetical protein